MKDIKRVIFIVISLIILIVVAFYVVGNFSESVTVTSPTFLPVLISSALVDSVNPCAFSVLIITTAFLASLGTTRRKVLVMGSTYIFGIFLVYFLVGVGMLKVLDILGIPNFLGKIGAILLIVFGISIVLSYFFPNFPIKFKIPNFAHGKIAKLISKVSLPAVFILGAFVALFEFPCTGGPYLMVLGLLHDKATFGTGLIYLFLYNLIFILPLWVILFIASEPELMHKAEELKKNTAGKGKVVAGIAMIILALVIFLTA